MQEVSAPTNVDTGGMGASDQGLVGNARPCHASLLPPLPPSLPAFPGSDSQTVHPGEAQLTADPAPLTSCCVTSLYTHTWSTTSLYSMGSTTWPPPKMTEPVR